MQFPSGAVDELLTAASTMIGPTVAAIAVHHRKKKRDRGPVRTVWSAQKRERVPVMSVYNTMGPRIFRRAFRMNIESFWRIYSILLPHIRTVTNRKRDYQCKGGRMVMLL